MTAAVLQTFALALMVYVISGGIYVTVGFFQ